MSFRWPNIALGRMLISPTFWGSKMRKFLFIVLEEVCEQEVNNFVYLFCKHINQRSITTNFHFDSMDSSLSRGYVSAQGKIMYCVSVSSDNFSSYLAVSDSPFSMLLKSSKVFLLDYTARIQSQIPFSPLGYEWI